MQLDESLFTVWLALKRFLLGFRDIFLHVDPSSSFSWSNDLAWTSLYGHTGNSGPLHWSGICCFSKQKAISLPWPHSHVTTSPGLTIIMMIITQPCHHESRSYHYHDDHHTAMSPRVQVLPLSWWSSHSHVTTSPGLTIIMMIITQPVICHILHIWQWLMYLFSFFIN